MTPPDVGARFLYVSTAFMTAALRGKPCTLVEVYTPDIQWPYRVRFDDGIESVAVDRDLAPIAEDGTVGEPMQPEPGSRRGWDMYTKMIKHSPNKIVATTGDAA
jgi:hypothetical protein